MSKVSIIVLARNRSGTTWRCLNSVLINTPREIYQLILIDDDSQDNTPDVFLWAKERQPDTIIYRQPSRLGVTPGRIKGIELGTGDIKMFLDDDTTICNSAWLPYLTDPFRDPLVGVTGQSGSYIREFGLWDITHADNVEVDCVQGYCMCFREIGLQVDPKYGQFWHEESDLCMQYKEKGYKVINRPFAGVDHAGSGSGDDGSYMQKLEYFKSKWMSKSDLLVPVRKRVLVSYW